MAIKVDIKVNLENIKDTLRKLNSPETVQTIGDLLVEKAKQMILAGVSPVTGDRFEGYKAVEGVSSNRSEANRAKKLASISAKEGDRKSQGVHLNAARDYQNMADRANKGYPYNVMKDFPGKTITPVNLFLSGWMLEYYKAIGRNGGLEIGYIDAPQDVLVRAQAHNDGPTNGRFAQRRTVPTNPGEEFTATIQRSIKDLYSMALGDILKK